jgi:hypothetical protein
VPSERQRRGRRRERRPNLAPDGSPARCGARSPRELSPARHRHRDHWPRPAGALAASLAEPTIGAMVRNAFAAAGARPISLADLAFYTGRRASGLPRTPSGGVIVRVPGLDTEVTGPFTGTPLRPAPGLFRSAAGGPDPRPAAAAADNSGTPDYGGDDRDSEPRPPPQPPRLVLIAVTVAVPVPWQTRSQSLSKMMR